MRLNPRTAPDLGVENDENDWTPTSARAMMHRKSTALGTVRAVLTGRVRGYTRPGSHSAIDKQPREGPVPVDASGLSGDEQGDSRVHGGPDKAVHCYAWAPRCSEEFLRIPVLAEPLRRCSGEVLYPEGRSWDGAFGALGLNPDLCGRVGMSQPLTRRRLPQA